LATLNEFDFEIIYIKGKENKFINALSRRVSINHVATVSSYGIDLQDHILQVEQHDDRYKIIANRTKPILSDHISQEQFAFIHNRHIHEAISSAQEALHSIKLKKLKGMVLKIDLSKAFDKVS